ncbi:hypothetical protein DSC45_01870 [Streptomyces sp. YIM 130001]|nr:hypothetical protein DSC45_01870 [Streptomyces sp. YIM 130001]
MRHEGRNRLRRRLRNRLRNRLQNRLQNRASRDDTAPDPGNDDDLAGDGAGLGQRQRRGGVGQRDPGGDLRDEGAVGHQPQDLGEVLTHPPLPGGAATPLARPEVVEVGAPAVRQAVPRREPSEELQDRQLRVALVALRRRRAVGDERAALAQQPPRLLHSRTADMVEDRVHAVRRQLPDTGVHVRVAVVDRCRTQGTHRLVVALRGRADHREAGVPCQLYKGGADSAVGAQDHDRAAGTDLGRAVEHLPGGDPVDDHGRRARRVHAVRHRHQVRGIDRQVTGPRAHFGDRGEPAADQSGVHTGSGRDGRTHQVVARHEGERRLVEVRPQAHLLLGERDARRIHPQHDLPLLRRRQLAGPGLQPLRLDLPGEHDLGGGDDGGAFRGVHGVHGVLLGAMPINLRP